MNFINAGKQQQIELAFDLIEKYRNNESIEIVDLTRAVSELLRKYHNQECAPNEHWINSQEIEALHALLAILKKGIEELEDIK
ncbi:hypothetical protein [Priestia megaterium]|uniref:hypothetical protein n=1 Tax=Priestia megaterium TaxID=1404 RepID=UPI002E1B8306|nr:hypothetical protein [Priestia megaterium]